MKSEQKKVSQMDSILEKMIDRHEDQLIELQKTIATREKDFAVLVKDVQYLSKDLTKSIDKLESSICKFDKTVQVHAERFREIDLNQQIIAKRWELIKSSWWKIVTISITVGAILEKTFDVVWQSPHK